MNSNNVQTQYALNFTLITLTFSAVLIFGTERPFSFSKATNDDKRTPLLVVLGIAQDAGYPQAACQKSCCVPVWENKRPRKHVSCLAIIDPQTSQRWIIDITPDFKEQLRMLDEIHLPSTSPGITGIFLTHGHIGHYTGLIHLGREVMGAKNIPVYAMPRMYEFLSSNGPWDQLVRLNNIALKQIQDGIDIQLNERISIIPFLVPHRDEYTETVGYRIEGPNRAVIYIPDIDKWEKWNVSIDSLISQVDLAYLDGTFYTDEEIPDRNIAEIPHPFIMESIRRFERLPNSDKVKIRFIHLNHTNPALITGSNAQKYTKKKGFGIAEELEQFEL